MGIWLLGNAVNNGLMSTGAFEVYYDGSLVWPRASPRARLTTHATLVHDTVLFVMAPCLRACADGGMLRMRCRSSPSWRLAGCRLVRRSPKLSASRRPLRRRSPTTRRCPPQPRPPPRLRSGGPTGKARGTANMMAGSETARSHAHQALPDTAAAAMSAPQPCGLLPQPKPKREKNDIRSSQPSCMDFWQSGMHRGAPHAVSIAFLMTNCFVIQSPTFPILRRGMGKEALTPQSHALACSPKGWVHLTEPACGPPECVGWLVGDSPERVAFGAPLVGNTRNKI